MHARTVGFYREGETSMLEQSLAGHGLLFGAMEITQDRPMGILARRLDQTSLSGEINTVNRSSSQEVRNGGR
jgi:hypothetical protein